jgi:predicted methyltransferase
VRQRRTVVSVAVVLLIVAGLFVADQALRTLRTLTIVERERDSWQRPDEILGYLDLHSGETVVDLGSGAGYFSLKIAPLVAPAGQVFAVDLRRQSLAFLWIRAVLGGHANLHTIRSEVDDPRLPAQPIDAVLVANTYHELSAPEPILKVLFGAMRAGARLVVVDRGPRSGEQTRSTTSERHAITPQLAEQAINRQGFQTVVRDNRFIDRSVDDDLWWLMIFRRP